MFYRCAPHAPATDHGHGIQVGQGKKHFTVDIHCHVAVPAADAALEGAEPSQRQKANAERNPLTAEINARQAESIAANLTDPKVRLKDMDRDGIDV